MEWKPASRASWRASRPARSWPPGTVGCGRLDFSAVVLFFEILLVVAVVVITWFALYAVYRLITDES